MKTKRKMKIKMNFHFCFHFDFNFCFCFCFLKVFAFLLTRPRGAIDGQLSLTWPRKCHGIFVNST